MDSDGELRLTIMATLAQEESRKKNNGHTIQRDCVTVIYIRCFAYAAASTFYWRCSRMAACVVATKSRNKQASSIAILRLQSKLFNGQSVNKTGGMIYSSPWYLGSFL